MSDNPTHYEVLGVDPTAPMTEIVSRYHYLRNVYSAYNMRYNDPRYQALNDAYRVLSNTWSRETYDDELREQGLYPHDEVINPATPIEDLFLSDSNSDDDAIIIESEIDDADESFSGYTPDDDDIVLSDGEIRMDDIDLAQIPEVEIAPKPHKIPSTQLNSWVKPNARNVEEWNPVIPSTDNIPARDGKTEFQSLQLPKNLGCLLWTIVILLICSISFISHNFSNSSPTTTINTPRSLNSVSSTSTYTPTPTITLSLTPAPSPTMTLSPTYTNRSGEILDLGDEAFQEGNYSRAIMHYTRLIEGDEENSESIYLSRAIAYQSYVLIASSFEESYIDSALDDYLMVLDINPENTAVYRERGLFYYELCLREITEYCSPAHDDLTEYQSRIDESDSEVTDALNDLETLLE